MNELTNPIKMEFVGHANEKNRLEKSHNRFTIEITPEEFKRIKHFPFPQLMTARIIDGKGSHRDGASLQLLNPFKEFHDSMSPTFMRIF